jgi:hypothetical protein
LSEIVGFLDKFHGAAEPPAISLLREAIEQLQVGIVTNLILEYLSRVDRAEVTFLADAVLSYATQMPPLQEETIRFSEAHRDVIDQVLSELSGVEEVAIGLSHLYAAITLQLAVEAGLRYAAGEPREVLPELATKLCERASDLGIHIPNTYEICGSGDAGECIRALAKFADDYRKRSVGTPPT